MTREHQLLALFANLNNVVLNPSEWNVGPVSSSDREDLGAEIDSRVLISAKPGTGNFGSRYFYYSRIDLASLNQNTPWINDVSSVSVHGILDKLNEALGLNILPEDVEDLPIAPVSTECPLCPRSVVLRATESSTFFKSEGVVNLGEKFSYPTGDDGRDRSILLVNTAAPTPEEAFVFLNDAGDYDSSLNSLKFLNIRNVVSFELDNVQKLCTGNLLCQGTFDFTVVGPDETTTVFSGLEFIMDKHGIPIEFNVENKYPLGCITESTLYGDWTYCIVMVGNNSAVSRYSSTHEKDESFSESEYGKVSRTHITEDGTLYLTSEYFIGSPCLRIHKVTQNGKDPSFNCEITGMGGKLIKVNSLTVDSNGSVYVHIFDNYPSAYNVDGSMPVVNGVVTHTKDVDSVSVYSYNPILKLTPTGDIDPWHLRYLGKTHPSAAGSLIEMPGKTTTVINDVCYMTYATAHSGYSYPLLQRQDVLGNLLMTSRRQPKVTSLIDAGVMSNGVILCIAEVQLENMNTYQESTRCLIKYNPNGSYSCAVSSYINHSKLYVLEY